MTAAWVIRAGRYGERDEWAIQNGVSGGGWGEWPDLTSATTREEVRALTAGVLGEEDARVPGYTGQVWALRGRISVGDIAILPMKTGKREIALGRVTGGYEFLADNEDPRRRHVVRVDWQRMVPRSVIKQDLLYSLNGASSVFSPSRNHAVERLEHLLGHGTDPGAIPFGAPTATPGPASAEDTVDAPELDTDIAEVARMAL